MRGHCCVSSASEAAWTGISRTPEGDKGHESSSKTRTQEASCYFPSRGSRWLRIYAIPAHGFVLDAGHNAGERVASY